jgi:hypothetical protein
MCHSVEQRLGAGEQAELGQRALAHAEQTRILETLAVFGLLGGNARPEQSRPQGPPQARPRTRVLHQERHAAKRSGLGWPRSAIEGHDRVEQRIQCGNARLARLPRLGHAELTPRAQLRLGERVEAGKRGERRHAYQWSHSAVSALCPCTVGALVAGKAPMTSRLLVAAALCMAATACGGAQPAPEEPSQETMADNPAQSPADTDTTPDSPGAPPSAEGQPGGSSDAPSIGAQPGAVPATGTP